MSAPTGGRWVFSVDTISGFTGVNLGINIGDSRAPVFPPAVPGKFNIEVFTKDFGVPSHPLDPDLIPA